MTEASDRREKWEEMMKPSPRPWWWRVPVWVPTMESRRLSHLDAENFKQRETVAEQLRRLDELLHTAQLDEREIADVKARINRMEHFRSAILDTERTLATQRQNLLLKTTAHATWAAAAAALSPVVWEVLKKWLRWS